MGFLTSFGMTLYGFYMALIHAFLFYAYLVMLAGDSSSRIRGNRNDILCLLKGVGRQRTDNARSLPPYPFSVLQSHVILSVSEGSQTTLSLSKNTFYPKYLKTL
jgi:hypothetical protein